MKLKETSAQSYMPKIFEQSDLKAVPSALKGGVLAIGNFDGLHRGHQAVIAEACAMARRIDSAAIMLTFEPHPRSFFQAEKPVFRLTNSAEKALMAEALGLDGIVHASFDHSFSSLSAEEFVDQIVVGQFEVQATITGYDFHFGKSRAGDPAFLQDQGSRKGFEVNIVEKFADEGNDAVSSSRIRDCLEIGDVAGANGLLGYRWFVTGEVIHGQKRGRELGFPTANIVLSESCKLAHGIYAVRVHLPEGIVHNGVASFGRRPQFDNGAPLLEVYLPDFSGDLYGQELRVQFLSFLRPEMRFDELDGLLAQMRRDTEEAVALGQALDFGGPLDQKIVPLTV